LGSEGLQRRDDSSQVLKKKKKERGLFNEKSFKQDTLSRGPCRNRERLTEGGVLVAAVEGASFPLEREEVVDI
jgi:hypothetical protein